MAATSNKNPKDEDTKDLKTQTAPEVLANEQKEKEAPKPEPLPNVMYVKHRSKGNFTGSTIEFPAGAPIYDKYQMHMLPKQGVELVTDRNECDRW